MQYTRKQIIEYLKIHHTASVPELSKALSLTLGNIRYHIKELESQQILEYAVGMEPNKSRGRPVLRYQLTLNSMDHNLIPLLKSILKHHTSGLDESERSKFYHEIANLMVSQIEQSRSPTHRIQHTIQWLNSHHYHARWEAYATGPRIILNQCPYQALLPDFPEICDLDVEIISQLTGLQMDLSEEQTEHSHRHHACLFTAAMTT